MHAPETGLSVTPENVMPDIMTSHVTCNIVLYYSFCSSVLQVEYIKRKKYFQVRKKTQKESHDLVHHTATVPGNLFTYVVDLLQHDMTLYWHTILL